MLLPLHLNGLNLDSGTAVASISGTLDGSTEADIVSGGRTIIITLTNDTWVASGATFDAQRQNIIDGLDAATSPANGWNNLVRDSALQVTDVARTSDTVVTITLPAVAGYDITANETITVTVPGTAVTGGSPLTGTSTIEISFVEVVADEEVFSGGYGAYNAYQAYLQRKEWRRKKREKLIRELEEIDNELDREIAQLIHTEDEREDENRNVEDLRKIVKTAFESKDDELQKYSARVAKAFIRAATQQNFSAMQALDREIERAMEEEEFLLMSVLLH